MSKPVEITAIAQEIVQVIPHVMRTIVAERYCSSRPMSPAHFRLLMILANHSCNLSELAVRQAVSLPTMSNSISVVVERGWVKRVQSPDDRRQVLLELMPEGRAVLTEIKSQAEARVAERLGQLSPGDLESLAAGLAVLERTFARLHCPRSDSPVQEETKRGQR